MKIIDDLADGAVKNNKEDSLAIKVSIFLAVILLGTVVFIVDSLKRDQYAYAKKAFGEYHVLLSEIDEKRYDDLKKNEDIEKVSFNKILPADIYGDIYVYGDPERLSPYEVKEGRLPEKENELLVPDNFFLKNKGYKVGSEITVRHKNYTIVGVYEDHSYSFEEPVLLSVFDGERKEDVFEEGAGVEAQIRYKSVRDTYTKTREILSDMHIDEKEALDRGRLFYNRWILEYKMVYPQGIVPPRHVVNEAIEKYGALFLLCVLFACIIYGAFNVWNTRDLREIALLKSAGMTEKQVKKLIRKKAWKLSTRPIAGGVVLSWVAANALLYFMWLNNFISYKNMSEIMGESLKSPPFHFVYPSPLSIAVIIALSLFTVYVSSIVPAKKSAKQKIIEGFNGGTEKNTKWGKSKIEGKVEKTLAKDYYRSYRSSYRVIVLSMALSAFVLTTVLVSQSYRVLEGKYNSYQSPYNFRSEIYTEKELDKHVVDELEQLDGMKELHVYQRNDTKFYPKENRGFLSKEVNESLGSGKKSGDRLYARIYALEEKDFKNLLEANSIPRASYVLLNRISEDDHTPYAFRKYSKVSDREMGEVILRYHRDGKPMKIKIDGSIEEIPYELEAYQSHEIAIYTDEKHMKEFIGKYGMDEANPVYNYEVKIKAEEHAEKVFENAEKILSHYIPKSDHVTSTDRLHAAEEKEQMRNERLLNLGIQTILIAIALSNAYNSFKGNFRARKNDFKLLSTAGMTEKQMRKMVFGEGKIVFRNIFAVYFFLFCAGIGARAYRSEYEFFFAIKELVFNMHYLPVLIVFLCMIPGVLLAVRSGLKDFK